MNTIAPYTQTAGYTSILTDLRTQFIDLQRQLGTGARSTTYGGLGTDRTISLSVNKQRSEIESYQQSISIVELRINVMDNAFERLDEIGRTASTEFLTGLYDLQGGDRTREQQTAELLLDEAIALLNTKADDRYVFAGRSLNTRPVEATDLILNGDTSRDGLRDLIAERKAADAGADGRGRVTIATTATQIALSEDGVHPFGFKITAADSTIANTVTTGPAGAPATATIDFGADNAVAGDEVRYTVQLPDNTTQEIVLTASDTLPLEEGQFEIGATVADTITNIETALGTALEGLAATELEAASATVAADAFFSADRDNPPLRVVGTPETATTLAAGTAADTVIWYLGETTAGNERSAFTANIDDRLSVEYGARADEDAFERLVKNLAVMASESFSAGDANDQDRYNALRDRVLDDLRGPPGAQTINVIRAQVSTQLNIIDATRDRHAESLGMLDDIRQRVEGVDNNLVATQLLTLQTRLEAAYQATARVAQLSLVNFL